MMNWFSKKKKKMKKKEELFAKDRVLLLKRLEFVQIFCMSVFPLGLFFHTKAAERWKELLRLLAVVCRVSVFPLTLIIQYM